MFDLVPLKYSEKLNRAFASVLWQLCASGKAKEHERAVFYARLHTLSREQLDQCFRLALETVLADNKASTLPDIDLLRLNAEYNGLGNLAGGLASMFRTYHRVHVEGVIRLQLQPSWADMGFPSIVIGHKLAASLLLTQASNDVLDNLQLPFPAFEIQLPDKLFYSRGSDGESRELRTLFGGRMLGCFQPVDKEPGDGYGIIAQSDNFALFSSKVSLKTLGKPLGGDENLEIAEDQDNRIGFSVIPFPIEEADNRTLYMLARLFCNVSLLMTNQGNYKKIGKGHSIPLPGRGRRSPAPTRRTYQLTTAVTHDFREVVREYFARGGKAPTTQTGVMGHFKHQAYGAKHSLRKYIFIEPYWRGPEDAPIAVRHHKLKDPT